jgi:hypothetical protein
MIAFEIARRLAAAHSHEWASPVGCGESHMPALDADTLRAFLIDATRARRRSRVAEEELPPADPPTLEARADAIRLRTHRAHERGCGCMGGISRPDCQDGALTHVTGTRRLAWTVRPTLAGAGAVLTLTVSRRRPEEHPTEGWGQRVLHARVVFDAQGEPLCLELDRQEQAPWSVEARHVQCLLDAAAKAVTPWPRDDDPTGMLASLRVHLDALGLAEELAEADAERAAWRLRVARERLEAAADAAVTARAEAEAAAERLAALQAGEATRGLPS